MLVTMVHGNLALFAIVLAKLVQVPVPTTVLLVILATLTMEPARILVPQGSIKLRTMCVRIVQLIVSFVSLVAPARLVRLAIARIQSTTEELSLTLAFYLLLLLTISYPLDLPC